MTLPTLHPGGDGDGDGHDGVLGGEARATVVHHDGADLLTQVPRQVVGQAARQPLHHVEHAERLEEGGGHLSLKTI